VEADDVFASIGTLISGGLDTGALGRIVDSGDPRFAWVIADLLRFSSTANQRALLPEAFEQLTGTDASADPSFAASPWLSITNHLIAWDLPEPPDYRDYKSRLFASLESGWAPFFADRDGNLDLRLISWGESSSTTAPKATPGHARAAAYPLWTIHRSPMRTVAIATPTTDSFSELKWGARLWRSRTTLWKSTRWST